MEQELWSYLKTAEKPIVLYGMGNGADKIISVLDSYGIGFDGVFASDGFVRDKLFHGMKISSYSELKAKYKDMIVLLCFGSARNEVIENVKRISSEQELYAPEVPVVGSGLFNTEYYNEHKADFDLVRSRLCDEQSVKTFDGIINYKISGKLSYLFDCEVPYDEPFSSILKLGKSESYLDLGAYNGDTVADFISRTGEYEKIIAVEPDIKNFRKLKAFCENLRDVTLINSGISSFCGTGDFGAKGGRNSAYGGKNKISFSTVDSVTDGEKVTFIKADIEGEEANAIKGAENTLKLHRPKLKIACYHRTEDLFAIPKAVFSVRDDYKLYIRHLPSLPAWDTDFYFV